MNGSSRGGGSSTIKDVTADQFHALATENKLQIR